MARLDRRVDAKFSQAPDFAQPIIQLLRKAIHQACPEVQETLKWGMPAFEYQGLLAIVGIFKSHCSLVLWKHQLLAEKFPELAEIANPSTGKFGRLTKRSDLPSQAKLNQYLKFAVALNAEGVRVPKRRKATRPVPTLPPEFKAALRRHKVAAQTFEKLSPSCQRDYVNWIADPKREETRAKRIATSIEWLAAGKKRNWKYSSC